MLRLGMVPAQQNQIPGNFVDIQKNSRPCVNGVTLVKVKFAYDVNRGATRTEAKKMEMYLSIIGIPLVFYLSIYLSL